MSPYEKFDASGKVLLFWEEHNTILKSPNFFDASKYFQIEFGDFVKFSAFSENCWIHEYETELHIARLSTKWCLPTKYWKLLCLSSAVCNFSKAERSEHF